MSSSRSERNRELIEKSAALLAADYPIGVLLERLSGAIASALGATCSVALPNEDGTAQVTSVTARGSRFVSEDELMPEGSRVARVFRTGRSILIRTPQDWEAGGGAEGFEDGRPAGVTSAVYVAASFGEGVVGVLGVQHPEPQQFDADDVRMLETIARYLAVAIRNQRTLRIAAVPVRYPGLLVAVVLLAALLACAGAYWWTHQRVTEAYERAAAAQDARLARAASVASAFLDADARFARLVAGVVGPVRNNRDLAQTLLGRILRASPAHVFGLGVFYEPGTFDAGSALYGPYAHKGADALVINTNPKTYNYPSLAWYRLGSRASGQVVFTEFQEQRVGFFSALLGVYDGKALRGVASVDSLRSSLVSAIRSSIAPSDRIDITDARGRLLLSSGPAISGPSRTASARLAPASWILHLAVSTGPVSDQVRQIVAWGVGMVLAILALTLAALGFLNVAYHARRDAFGLKVQRAELQSEIATRIEAEERLRSAAYHDALTGLPNRTFFLDRLAEVVEHHRSDSRGEYAVLFVDLDRFYVVNESMGHTSGDALLAAIAARIEEVIPAHALIARLGGDEFVLLLPSEGSVVREAVAVAEDVLEALRNPFTIEGREVFSGASIGIVHLDASYENAETLLRDADISMYHAKNAGRAGYAVFDRSMRDRVTHQLELESGLRGAVEREEIVAHYQPIVRIADGTVVSFEALARWDREGKGTFVPAYEFIEVAERTGMLRAIDAALFEQICRDAKAVLASHPDLKFSVNISATDLTRPSLLADIDATMQRFSMTARAFKIEITETAVMGDAERALAVLGELRARGFEISVDDFGVGYSSLSYLQRLPIGGLKIDRSFIVSLPADGQALEITRAIVALAKTLGLSVTAEGVERRDQLEVLAKMGVDYAQGYWYSPAVDLERAQSFLTEHRKTLA
jgi:diguanylate cyclase (GGDEF)-like protein